MNYLKYYWDKFYLTTERMWHRYFDVDDPLLPYKIWCQDDTYSEHSLAEILIRQQESIDILNEKYDGLLCDVKRLEEENIGLTNELYEIYNIIDSTSDQKVDLSKFSLGE